MAEKHEVPLEVIDPDALAAHLPAVLPVRGPDGELIEGAVAKIDAQPDGTVTAEIRMPCQEAE